MPHRSVIVQLRSFHRFFCDACSVAPRQGTLRVDAYGQMQDPLERFDMLLHEPSTSSIAWLYVEPSIVSYTLHLMTVIYCYNLQLS